MKQCGFFTQHLVFKNNSTLRIFNGDTGVYFFKPYMRNFLHNIELQAPLRNIHRDHTKIPVKSTKMNYLICKGTCILLSIGAAKMRRILINHYIKFIRLPAAILHSRQLQCIQPYRQIKHNDTRMINLYTYRFPAAIFQNHCLASYFRVRTDPLSASDRADLSGPDLLQGRS